MCWTLQHVWHGQAVTWLGHGENEMRAVPGFHKSKIFHDWDDDICCSLFCPLWARFSMTLERLTFSNASKKGWFSRCKPQKVKHVSGQFYFFRIICANVEMVHRICGVSFREMLTSVKTPKDTLCLQGVSGYLELCQQTMWSSSSGQDYYKGPIYLNLSSSFLSEVLPSSSWHSPPGCYKWPSGNCAPPNSCTKACYIGYFWIPKNVELNN